MLRGWAAAISSGHIKKICCLIIIFLILNTKLRNLQNCMCAQDDNGTGRIRVIFVFIRIYIRRIFVI